MRIAFWVALGSGFGGLARVLAGMFVFSLIGGAFPYAILFVNTLGSFLIGFLATLTGPGGRLFWGPELRQFFLAGVCGGFTTFSFFSLETFALIEAARYGPAALYSAATLFLVMLGVWLGRVVALRLNRLPA